MKVSFKGIALVAGVLLSGAAVFAGGRALAYSGEYTGNGAPQFNIYQGVNGVGDERDFVRIGNKGAAVSTYTNSINACEGEFDVWVYVHNGAPEGYNTAEYNYSGIAQNTKLGVNIANNGTITGTVSASNAASVSDSARINCDQDVKISYVSGTNYTGGMGVVDLGNPTAAPVALGYSTNNGKVPGCWEYRNYVKMTVKVEKKEVPQVIKTCSALSIFKDSDRTKRILEAAVPTAEQVQNTTVNRYYFEVRNSNGDKVFEKSVDANTTRVTTDSLAPGDYTAKLVVQTAAGDADHTSACDGAFTIEEAPANPIYECTLVSILPVADKKNTYNVDITTLVEPSDRVSVNVSKSNITVTGPNGEILNLDGVIALNDLVLPMVDGTYTAKASVVFTVDGEDQDPVHCENSVTITTGEETPPTGSTPPTTVTKLPRTGAGSTLALFALVTTFAGFAYNRVVARMS